MTLSKAKWKEIRNLLKKKDRNMSKIARKYGISRNSLYRYANKRNWLIKKEPKKSIWKKILNFWIKLCPKIDDF
jgi:transposase-like protein